MMSRLIMSSWLMVFVCLATARCSNVTEHDQETSATQVVEPQVAIIKQIRKVNEDGSYTFGYEAGDGSFKVESRDVLGNIKGTFGFVDANGEIKRVSYSSSNGTGFQSTTVSPLQEQLSVVQNIPRNNRTTPSFPSPKKPTFIYTTTTTTTTTTEPPLKSSVVQPIPRLRKPSSPSMSSTTTMGSPPMNASESGSSTMSPAMVAKESSNLKKLPFLRSKSRHRFVINGQQRPLVYTDNEETDQHQDEDSQIGRPGPIEKAAALTKVVFTKRPLDQNLRPITEIFEEKEEDTKITSGNALRRQLQDETTKMVPVEEDEHSDVYGGALSTTRPLFTTTTTAHHTRGNSRLNSLRSESQKKVYGNQEDVGPARFTPKNEGPKVYENEAKDEANERENMRPLFVRAKPSSEGKDYSRQSTEPVYVQQQPEIYLRDGRVLIPAPVEEEPGYRTVPLTRSLLRNLVLQQQQHQQQQQQHAGHGNEANIQYLTETTPGQEPLEPLRVPINPGYVPRHRLYQRQYLYPENLQDPRGHRGPLLRPIIAPVQPPPPAPVHPDDREYQPVHPDYPYRVNQLALPPEHPNPIAPPLSRRDFQLLLRRLLVSQYGIQALNYPRTYLEDALLDPGYPGYQPVYQTVPRGEVPYGPEPGVPPGPAGHPVSPVAPPPPPPAPAHQQGHYQERVPLRRPVYAPPPPLPIRGINPLYQPNPYEDYPDTRYAKRVYRQKFYTPEPEVDQGDEEILPPEIREALLLRMLQLAISDRVPVGMQHQHPVPMPATMMGMNVAVPTTTTPRFRKGPVRNVQIIGEDVEEEKVKRKPKV